MPFISNKKKSPGTNNSKHSGAEMLALFVSVCLNEELDFSQRFKECKTALVAILQ